VVHERSRGDEGVPVRGEWKTIPSDEPVLFAANHPTLIDVVALISRFPEIDCVVKIPLRDHGYFGGAVRAAGYITNDAGAQFLDQATLRLNQGRSLILFPEGTRSPAFSMHRFNRGLAHLALDAGAKIVPVVIRCNPPTLMRGQRWWEIPEKPIFLSLTFCDPEEVAIPPEGAGDRSIRARVLTRSIEDFFRNKLGLSDE